jgi:hypothetical protein
MLSFRLAKIKIYHTDTEAPRRTGGDVLRTLAQLRQELLKDHFRR